MKFYSDALIKFIGFLLMLVAIGAMARLTFFFINIGWSIFD
jgi:hypothetical protein